MIKMTFNGRLGNLILENIGISILAKKFNHNHDRLTEDDCKVLGVSFYNGELSLDSFENYSDDNLMDLLKLDKIDHGIIYEGYFQVKDFVVNYKQEILDHFKLIYENSNNNDVFIHVRLGDVPDKNPGLDYYINALNSINFNNAYISSDTTDHYIIKTLIEKYNMILYNDTPINTINFAKNFNNVILSKGTFSWWIGFLSKSKNIIYPKGCEGFCGDIFVYDDWIEM